MRNPTRPRGWEPDPSMTCPHCGCREFYVRGWAEYVVQFSFGHSAHGPDVDIGEREHISHRELQQVRCAGCGKLFGTRRDLEAAGWPVPA